MSLSQIPCRDEEHRFTVAAYLTWALRERDSDSGISDCVTSSDSLQRRVTDSCIFNGVRFFTKTAGVGGRYEAAHLRNVT